jgi:hypothetical protein
LLSLFQQRIQYFIPRKIDCAAAAAAATTAAAGFAPLTDSVARTSPVEKDVALLPQLHLQKKEEKTISGNFPEAEETDTGNKLAHRMPQA